MKYIAHAGVKLKDGFTTYKNNEWHYIKTIDGIEYRWRLCADQTYEVIAGLFGNRYDALLCAKKMYVTMLYSLLTAQFSLATGECATYIPRLFYNEEEDGPYDEFFINESFFFWKKKHSGGQHSPGVYEAEASLDEFNDYRFLNATYSISYDSDLTFDNVDEYVFTYNKEAQELLHSVIIADNEMNYGMKMTIYCSILEHLSENEKKSLDVQLHIDELIESIKTSTLSPNEKDQLINHLRNGKEQSANQKCKKLAKKYAKAMYGQYPVEKIISEAYGIRSAFSHGDNVDPGRTKLSSYIKYVVLDVIKGYMREKESANN